MSQISPMAKFALETIELKHTEAGWTATIRNQLPREIYQEVDRILKALGADWIQNKKYHLFDTPNDPTGIIQNAILNPNFDANPLDYFPTPPEMADDLLNLAFETTFEWIKFLCTSGTRKPTVLEPSAGTGNLIEALIRRINRPIEDVDLTLIEKDPVRAEILRTKFPSARILNVDFIEFSKTDETRYDMILMNPPFDGRTWATHVITAQKLLRNSQSELVAIVPDNADKAQTHPEFRYVVNAHGHGTTYELNGDFKNGPSRRTRTTVKVKAVGLQGSNPDEETTPHQSWPNWRYWTTSLYIDNDSKIAAEIQKYLESGPSVAAMIAWLKGNRIRLLDIGCPIKDDAEEYRFLANYYVAYNIPETDTQSPKNQAEPTLPMAPSDQKFTPTSSQKPQQTDLFGNTTAQAA